MRTTSADEVVLVGEVVFVVYSDSRSGFGVIELGNLDDSVESSARATGPLARLVPGQPVALHGRWTTHPKYGRTFSASYFTPSRPQSTAALEVFLSGEQFPGIGPKHAKSLVDAFGLRLPDVIADDPAQLTQAAGLPERLRKVLVEGWRQAGALAALVGRLGRAGIGVGPARWLVAQFADRAADLLDHDPYLLLGAPGISWQAVERLARDQQIAHDDPVRLVAAATEALHERRRERGDVAIDGQQLLVSVQRLLGSDEDVAQHALRRAVEDGELTTWAAADDATVVRYALIQDADAEIDIADAVARLDREVLVVDINDEQVLAADPQLTAEQQAAVRMTFANAVSMLTGGPGTGKTRTVAAILRCAAAMGLQVALCAPTGRAAKRLEELCGHRATTIHRLLEARPEPEHDDRFSFSFDRTRRLPQDLIIADEWSMADLELAHALITAVADGSRLLMVGDVDQLPPVGPGAVLRDLLAVAGVDGAPVAATTLDTVHRQAAASRIITLAHELKAGRAVVPRGRDNDVFAVPQATSGLAERVAEIVAVRVPDYFDCTPADVQVLAPRYAGPAGVDRLNDVLRDRLNPRGTRPTVSGFCEGDRVVQTRNNVELDVANGEVGEVVATDAEEVMVEVAFATGTVHLGAREVRDLRPAWCLTVHKSQGGQWPVVVLVLDPTHRRMLWRELTYTAVTRAVSGLLLVGMPHLLVEAARRTGSGIAQRSTGLADRLLTR